MANIKRKSFFLFHFGEINCSFAVRLASKQDHAGICIQRGICLAHKALYKSVNQRHSDWQILLEPAIKRYLFQHYIGHTRAQKWLKSQKIQTTLRGFSRQDIIYSIFRQKFEWKVKMFLPNRVNKNASLAYFPSQHSSGIPLCVDWCKCLFIQTNSGAWQDKKYFRLVKFEWKCL